jgi:hypothetical protein
MPFDRYFLKDVPQGVFIKEARALQGLLTNTAISEAFKVWPANIFELDGEEIISKITERREKLVDFAREFKIILDSKEPLDEPLKGSEELELNGKQLTCFECLSPD